jgi:DNA-binding NarL/FixJ family response regulator
MATKTTVLIIEDNLIQREELRERLAAHKMTVYDAGTKEEARREAERRWDELDVVIIDMELDDPATPPFGPEIVMEVRDRKKDSFPPEFIVFTRYSRNDYYRFALNLGAAAYLKKGIGTPVVHVKVLALRRALNGKNPKIASEVERIAVQSGNISEAILTFCRTLLQSAFETYLGVTFVILFTEGATTQNCAGNAGLPAGISDFYHTLQALAHGKGNPTEPFVLEIDKLELNQEDLLLYKKLDGAAFLPISLSNEMKLSIGILRPENDEGKKTPEQTYEEIKSRKVPGQTYEEILCTVLAQHLRPTVLENIISLWSLWTDSYVTRNSIAKLCLRVGQEINDGLTTGNRDQIQELADDLIDTAQYLTYDSLNWNERGEEISVTEVIETSWELIAQSEDRPVTKLDLQGHCVVRAQRRDMAIIISRLLQWFAYRGKATPLDVPPVIKVKCETTDRSATITFEDNSYRLPPELRRRLFETFSQAISTPFPEVQVSKFKAREVDAEGPENAPLKLEGRYLPLYLAKVLVEGRYHGNLKDHSDEIVEHNYGHRIMIQLPVTNKLDGGRN